jgi:hypothetical protein
LFEVESGQITMYREAGGMHLIANRTHHAIRMLGLQ